MSALLMPSFWQVNSISKMSSTGWRVRSIFRAHQRSNIDCKQYRCWKGTKGMSIHDIQKLLNDAANRKRYK